MCAHKRFKLLEISLDLFIYCTKLWKWKNCKYWRLNEQIIKWMKRFIYLLFKNAMLFFHVKMELSYLLRVPWASSHSRIDYNNSPVERCIYVIYVTERVWFLDAVYKHSHQHHQSSSFNQLKNIEITSKEKKKRTNASNAKHQKNNIFFSIVSKERWYWIQTQAYTALIDAIANRCTEKINNNRTTWNWMTEWQNICLLLKMRNSLAIV